MSLVIAVKDKDRVVVGADKQASTGDIKDHNVIKIWDVPDLPGAIMGGVGTVRASQIIQYSPIIDKNFLEELNTPFVVTHIVPTIVSTLEANGMACTQEGTSYTMMPNAFIFAYEDRAWMIWHDLSVTEIVDYLAIGSGSDVAKGVLFATSDKNPFERIVTGISAAAENTLYVDDAIDILTTKAYSEDAQQLADALEVDLNLILEANNEEIVSEGLDEEIENRSTKKRKIKTSKESKKNTKKSTKDRSKSDKK